MEIYMFYDTEIANDQKIVLFYKVFPNKFCGLPNKHKRIGPFQPSKLRNVPFFSLSLFLGSWLMACKGGSLRTP